MRGGVAALAAIFLAAAGPATPQARLDRPIWAARFARQHAALMQDRYDLILLGDSIIRELTVPGSEDWSDVRRIWDGWFACHRAIDLGYAGDTTANLLWRIENGGVPASPPRAAVLLIGTNNNRPGLGWSGADTAAAIGMIVDRLHARFPGMRIVLLGVPPNAHGRAVAAKIDATNAALAATDWADRNAIYFPTRDLFLRGGSLDPTLYREPHRGGLALHPDTAGWRKIVTLVAPELARALGTPSLACPQKPS